MKTSRLHSLRARLLLLVILALVPAFGLLLYATERQRELAAAWAQRNAMDLARLAAADQERLVDGARQILVTFAELGEVQNLMSGEPLPEQQNECNRLFARLVGLYPAYINFGVVEPDGDVICSALPARRGVNEADRWYFQSARATAEFTVGEYQVDRVSGRPILNAAYPVRSTQGDIVGLVFASFDLGWLNQFAADAELPAGITLTLIDRTGTILVRHPEPALWVGRSVPDAPITRAILASGGEGLTETRGIDGVQRLYAFTPVEQALGGREVFLSVGIPAEVAYAGVERLARLDLFALLIVATLALLAAWFGSEFFVLRRVRALGWAAERLSRGELGARTELTYDRDEIGELARTFDGMARSLEGQVVQVNQFRGDAERAAARAELLAEASNVLASSLDYEDTLRRVADLAVAAMADWCVVDILENGTRRVEVAHADPAQDELARALREQYPPDPSWEDHPIIQVIRTGEPVLVPEMTDEILRDAASDAEHLRILRAIAPQSIMVVPLTARQQRLGAMLFASTRAGRRFGPDDLALATELARRAAVAVDNARLYEHALIANRAKSDFLAVMSHELRTPLNAVIGYADLLDAGITGPLEPAQQKQVQSIRRNALRLLELIDEILTFSRMESGREQVQLERADMAELAREAVAMAEQLVREKHLAFHNQIPDEVVEAETDPPKVRRILLNLLSNAVKFTQSGEVGLRMREAGEDILFEVWDTGIGIAPQYREKIFESFYQIEESTTRERGGTGLGLTIARRLARLLGGDLEVRSEVGKGSTFTVRLPARRHRPRGG